MARKSDGIIWYLMDAPWWLSVILSIGVYVALSYVLPELAASSNNFVFNAVAPNLSMFAPYFALLFFIPASIAFFKQFQRRQRYRATTSHIRSKQVTTPFHQLSWLEFESYVGEYFKHQGYAVKQSFSQKPDGGIDIWLTKDGELSLVQCKHWKAKKVGIQVLREMYGVMIEHHASKMIIVTSGDFTSEAIAYAQDKRLWLVNGSELVHIIEDGRSFENKPPKSTSDMKLVPKVCPNCQSVLVKRVAKRGVNKGKAFYGCTSFPTCRYTIDYSKPN
ncbi:restriction endonuclease [Vibrio jasicida]|uniref:restriction endonuclease n=1 Tax=Vibrio jasicida TaxID=766224 RepID=UPI0003A2E567|nr:restriction endonuclease [Vibrio jasicida]